MGTPDPDTQKAWYLTMLDNFRIPRPKSTPSVRDFEESWNVPASMKSRPRQTKEQPTNLNRYDNYGSSPNEIYDRRSDEILIVRSSNKNGGCNKLWYLLIPLVLLLLAAIGVILYFGLCYWGWSNLSCGNNSKSTNTSSFTSSFTSSTTASTISTTVSPCNMECLNGGKCDLGANPPRCQCPEGIKTLDCSCNDVSTCCGDKTIYIPKGNYSFEKLFQSSGGFASGYCEWEFITNSTNGMGGYLNMTLINVDFLLTSSCDDNYAIFYNSSDVTKDPKNIIAKICSKNENDFAFSTFSSPSFSINWTITEPNQNLYINFAEQSQPFSEDADYCQLLNNPCGSGATCESQNLNYYCHCLPNQFGGGEGTPCRESTVCDVFPTVCQNGGTCNGSADDFTCTCPSSFTGQVCETPISLI